MVSRCFFSAALNSDNDKAPVVLAKCIGRRQKGQATAENQAIYTVVRPGEYLTGADGPDKAGSAREELSVRFQMTD